MHCGPGGTWQEGMYRAVLTASAAVQFQAVQARAGTSGRAMLARSVAQAIRADGSLQPKSAGCSGGLRTRLHSWQCVDLGSRCMLGSQLLGLH